MGSGIRPVSVAERQARLAVRHRLAPQASTVAARAPRWCRTASRARRSATLTGRITLPMATTLVPSDRD